MYSEFSLQKLIEQAKGVFFRHKHACFAGSIAIYLLLRIPIMKLHSKIVEDKSPPRLYGIPFFGSLFTMLFMQKEFRLNILPKYGDLVTYNIGNLKFYKIQNIDLCNKVFQIAQDRPEMFAKLNTMHGYEPAISTVNQDKCWAERRKLLMDSLTLVLDKLS